MKKNKILVDIIEKKFTLAILLMTFISCSTFIITEFLEIEKNNSIAIINSISLLITSINISFLLFIFAFLFRNDDIRKKERILFFIVGLVAMAVFILSIKEFL